MSEQTTRPKFLAFISYAREDESFARRLETEIEAFRFSDNRSAPAIFRDRSDFTGNAYHSDLEKHLLNSEALIVVCSPHARKSEFVGDEIRKFAKLHGKERIFPVLLSGLAENEAESQKAFPQALLEVMGADEIPLGAEYQGFGKPTDQVSRGRFESDWYKLLGNLYGISPAEIRDGDKQQQVKKLRLRQIGYVVAVLVLLVVLAVIWSLKKVADRNKHEAELAQTVLSIAVHEAQLAKEKAEKLEAIAKQISEKAETELAVVKRPAEDTADAAEPLDRLLSPPNKNAGSTKPHITTSTQASAKPRVYFQISESSQQPLADKLKNALQAMDQKYVVPPYEHLEVGPADKPELRYFRDSEQAEAQSIVAELQKAGLSNVVVKKVPGYENSPKIRPRHFELWMRLDSPTGN